jgi:hypothetical protein
MHHLKRERTESAAMSHEVATSIDFETKEAAIH